MYLKLFLLFVVGGIVVTLILLTSKFNQ